MIFIFLTVLGFILLVIAIKLFIKKNRLKEIAYGNILGSQLAFSINKSGLYSISWVGITPDFNVTNLKPKLSSLDNKNIVLQEYFFKPTFLRKRKRCYSQWYFFVDEHTEYKLRFENLAKFLVQHPVLNSSKILSNRKFQTEKLDVLIKEGMKSQEYFVMILALVFGFNCFSLGIIMGLNQHLF